MASTVGGQAVLEGVMMRGPGNWAVAVRTPSGDIAQVSRSIESQMARHRLLRLPIVRRVMALGESLAIGFRAPAVSANYTAQGGPADGGAERAVSTELSRFIQRVGARAFRPGVMLLGVVFPAFSGRLRGSGRYAERSLLLPGLADPPAVLIRFAGKHQGSRVLMPVFARGLWLGRLTRRQ